MRSVSNKSGGCETYQSGLDSGEKGNIILTGFVLFQFSGFDSHLSHDYEDRI
nr:MAG TPA: hypothetical protein [Caudoviricetes sp.]